MPLLAVDMADYHEPSAEDIDAARVAARALSNVHPAGKFIRFCVEAKEDAPAPEPISIPLGIYKTIIDLLVKVGNGNAVQLVPVKAELTTQQAADLLNVSRPHLIKLLNEEELAHRMVGTHRKVLAKDVLAYRDKSTAKRREVLQRMMATDHEMGIDNDEPISVREM